MFFVLDNIVLDNIVLPLETGEQPSLSLLRVKSIIERALAYLQAPWVTL